MIKLKHDSYIDGKLLNNLSFKDILETVLEFEDSTEEQLQALKQYYYNNVRDVEKEYYFYIEVNELYKELEEEGVPIVLIDFVEFINNIVNNES